MFDDRAFRTWPQIVAGALLFAGLFMVVALLTERVFAGRFVVSRAVIGLGGGAFLGYLATAWLVREADDASGH